MAFVHNSLRRFGSELTMPINNPQYDVAISFLSRDQSTAEAIQDKLAEGLRVFFYPRKQEELAGTDGLESMRKPFFDDSRVVVILYREPWGETPWTRVEETAIKDGCLEQGWKRLFFIVLDKQSALPRWLPETHIRLDYAAFGLEQAVGAIKARVQENGGAYQPMTAIKKAEILDAERRFQQDKARMISSEEGVENVVNNVALLFEGIQQRCVDINAKGSRFLRIRCETTNDHRCIVTDGGVALLVAWIQRYTNTLSDTSLIVREFDGRLLLPSEMAQGQMLMGSPQTVRETRYLPDLSRTREYGWRATTSSTFLSSPNLAEQCVIDFLDLASRHGRWGDRSGK
jgi:hypothetical protein